MECIWQGRLIFVLPNTRNIKLFDSARKLNFGQSKGIRASRPATDLQSISQTNAS